LKKKLLITLIILLIFSTLFFKLNVSSLAINPLKKEIKKMTGLEVSIGKVYLNLIPLYLEINALSFTSFENERNCFTLPKAKIYLSLSRIINKEIDIRRIVLFNFSFSSDEVFLNRLIENIKVYLKEPIEISFKIIINSIEIENLSVILNKNNLILSVNNLHGRAILKNNPKFNFITNLKISTPEYPKIDTNIKTSFYIKDDKIFLQELKIFDIYSLVKSSGILSHDSFLGEFFITGKIFFNSLMNFLGIKNKSNGQINLDGTISFQNATELLDKVNLDINFDGHFLLQELMQILKVSEKLEGYTKIIQGKIKGSLSNFQISAKAQHENGNILGVKVKNVNTDVYYKNGILEFTNGKVNLYGGTANACVWINLPVVTRHHVYVEFKKVSSSGIFELINWNPHIAEGEVEGWLMSEGDKFSPRGEFVYLKNGNSPNDVRGKIHSFRGVFESDGEVYNFKSLKISLSKTNAFAHGSLNLKNMNLNFYFEGNTEDVNELLSPYQTAFHGDALLQGSIVGTTKDPQINLQFSSKIIKIFLKEFIKSLDGEPLIINNLSGDFKYRKNELIINKLSSLDIISVTGKINFQGAKKLFDLQEPLFNLSFMIHNQLINNLYLEPLDKSLHTNIDITGFIKGKGDIEGNLYLSNVFMGKEKIFDSIVASLKYEKNSIFINKSVFYSGSDNINLNGYINCDGNINITGYSKNFDITKLIKENAEKIGAKYLQSFAVQNLKFNITNSYKQPDISMQSEVNIKNKSGRIIDGNIKANLNKEKINMNFNLFKNANFKITGFLNKKQWNIQGELKSSRIDPIFGFFINNLPEDLVILVDGKINSLINENEKISGQLNFNRIFARLYGVGLNNKSPVAVIIKDGNIYFDPIIFIGQSTEIKIKGKVVDYFDILVEGSTDLRPFKSFINVDDIKGRASMLVYIYENRKHPEIAGEIEIKDSFLTIRKDIPTISNLNSIISFNEDRVIIEKTNGKFSEGDIQLSGSLYLKNFEIDRISLTGNFSKVRWIFSPRSWAYLDGDVFLSGTKLNPKLSGNININRGSYLERVDLVEFALKSNIAKKSVIKNSWFSNLSLNLRIQPHSFYINNNIAEMTLKGDMILKGTLNTPSILGWVTAKDGWIYFRNNKFEILRFLIQFNDSDTIRPYLNISARTNISQYNVNLNLNGYIDQFNLILNSNPPLSENDLLNLLVLGQNDGKGTVPGSSEATSFITGQIQGVMEERVRGITGLDVLTVEPSISKTTGSISPRVTVGKKLMDGKLTVTYSIATGTTAEQIIKVEYSAKKGIYLIGLRDEIGGLSGAIKFRFEFH